jgi:hypothetical protein
MPFVIDAFGGPDADLVSRSTSSKLTVFLPGYACVEQKSLNRSP